MRQWFTKKCIESCVTEAPTNTCCNWPFAWDAENLNGQNLSTISFPNGIAWIWAICCTDLSSLEYQGQDIARRVRDITQGLNHCLSCDYASAWWRNVACCHTSWCWIEAHNDAKDAGSWIVVDLSEVVFVLFSHPTKRRRWGDCNWFQALPQLLLTHFKAR